MVPCPLDPTFFLWAQFCHLLCVGKAYYVILTELCAFFSITLQTKPFYSDGKEWATATHISQDLPQRIMLVKKAYQKFYNNWCHVYKFQKHISRLIRMCRLVYVNEKYGIMSPTQNNGYSIWGVGWRKSVWGQSDTFKREHRGFLRNWYCSLS